jgi:hypothetical protein
LKKNFVLALSALAIFTASTQTAFSQDEEAEPVLRKPPVESTEPTTPEQTSSAQNIVQLGLNLYKFDYAEYVPTPLKSTENAVLSGLNAEFTHLQAPDSWFLRAALDFTSGNTQYDGTTQLPAATPVQATTNNFFANIEGNFGYTLLTLSKDSQAFVRAYTGLGYRYWRRGDETENPNEEYSWFYAPVGLVTETNLSDSFKLGLDASVKFMFSGKIIVHFPDPIYNTPTAGLGSKPSYKVKFPLSYKLNSSFQIMLIPWFEYSSIGRGETFIITRNGTPYQSGYEPESRTVQFGSLLAVGLSF